MKTLVRVIPLFFIVEAFNVEDILLFFFDDISTYDKSVIAATLSLSFALKTSLVVLIFDASSTLVDGRLLKVFSTRYVSRKGISRLIFPQVFLLLFCKPVPSETLDIDLINT